MPRSWASAALVAVVVYIAGFALSWGPVAWVMLSEMFPNSIKGKAMGLAVAAQWIANLLVSASFKILDGSSVLNAMFNHGFAYWIYGAMSILAALFVMRYVPETKGRSLEAIQDLWGKPEAAVAPSHRVIQIHDDHSNTVAFHQWRACRGNGCARERKSIRHA